MRCVGRKLITVMTPNAQLSRVLDYGSKYVILNLWWAMLSIHRHTFRHKRLLRRPLGRPPVFSVLAPREFDFPEHGWRLCFGGSRLRGRPLGLLGFWNEILEVRYH